MEIWSDYQLRRLAHERYLLRTEGFDQFEFYNARSPHDCYLQGNIYTSCNQTYVIRIELPNFPYNCPSVYVMYPNPLRDCFGQNMATMGPNSKMHILTPKNNQVQLCLYKSSSWDYSVSLTKLVFKAYLWFEAYEKHLISRRPIDDFVLEM